MDGRLRDIRALVAMAGVDSSHAAPFLAQLDRLAVEAYADRTPPKEADMTFVSALEQWIAAAHPLPDGQRAASLLAADQLLEGGLGHFGIAAHSPSADSAQKRLAALGVGIFFNDADADWLYTHSWLVEAARIDKGAARQEFPQILAPCPSGRRYAVDREAGVILLDGHAAGFRLPATI